MTQLMLMFSKSKQQLIIVAISTMNSKSVSKDRCASKIIFDNKVMQPTEIMTDSKPEVIMHILK